MKIKTSPLLLLPLLFCVGCRTIPRAAHPSTPVLVHHEPTERELEKRAAELTKAGYSPEAADRKARREFASKAWNYDAGSAWAGEKAREERSAHREQMEKALAKLPAF